ncbi:MAG: hypothetical protein ACOCRK_07020 [bacterium]
MSIAIGYDEEGNKIKVYKSLRSDKWIAAKEDTHNPDTNTELYYRSFNTKKEAIYEAKFILLQDYISNTKEIEQLLNNPYINIKFDFMKHWKNQQKRRIDKCSGTT